MWWWIAAFVVSMVASYFLMPRPEVAKPPEVEEVDIPTVEDGKTIPVLFGTRDTESFNVVWWGDVNTRSFKVSAGDSSWYLDIEDVHGGYRYFVGIHAILFHGPIDYITRVESDDKVAWSGEQADGVICDIGSIELYGDVDAEGGFGERTINWDDGDGDWLSDGCLEILMGYPDQERNWYLEHNLDGGDAVGDTGAHEVPAFRGVVSAVFNRFYIGNSPQLRKILFRGQRVHVRQDGLTQWYDAKAEIAHACSDEVAVESYDRNDFVVSIPHGRRYVATHPEEEAIRKGTVDFIKWARIRYAPQFEAGGEWPDYKDGDGNQLYAWFGVGDYGSQSYVRRILPTASDSEFNAFYAEVLNPGYDDADIAGDLIYDACFDGHSVCSYDESIRNANQSGDSFYNLSDHFSQHYSLYSFFPGDPMTDDMGLDCYYNRAEQATEQDDVDLALAQIQTSITNSKPVHYYSIGVNYSSTAYSGQIDTATGVPTLVTLDPDDIDASAAIVTQHLKDLHLGIAGDADEGIGSQADINPAHIIRECLTDPDWGMGGDELSPDEDAFVYAADYLYNESMGISIKWTAQTSIDDFIDLIKRHINAELYPDHSTGKQILKLIRDDYDVNDLITLGEDDIVKVENAKRPLIGELINSVTVQYWDTCTGKDASVTVVDQALVQMQGSTINTTVQYPGFTNKPIAVKAATRDLRVLSTQLLSCTLHVKRTAETLNLGSVFIMQWPDLEIDDVVMRVQGIDFGTGRSNTIKLDVVEDIFSLPTVAVVGDDDDDPTWTNPSQDPVDTDYRLAFEMPYHAIVVARGKSAVDDKLTDADDAGWVGAAAVRAGNAINATFSTDSGSGYTDVGTLQFCATCLLTAAVDQIETAWTFDNAVDIGIITVGTWAQIDDELVVIYAIDSAAGTIRVGRGVMDTSPRSHADNARIFFWNGYRGLDNTEYADADSVAVKIQPTTGAGTLDIADATAESVTLDERADRPYPPADLQIDAVEYPTASVIATSFDVTWAQRNRLTQTALLDHTDASVTDEVGCTYTIYVIDSSDVTQITHTGETGTSKTVAMDSNANGNYTLQIWAVRDSKTSWQCAEWAFTYAGYGAPDFYAATYVR